MTPNLKLKTLLTTPSRYKVLYGGRGSSKSWSVCLHLLHLARNYKLQILCLRQFQNRITDSVYSLLKLLIAKNGYENEFTITNKNIIHNQTKSKFLFLGIARNLGEIKSLEGTDICYFEEAENITKEQMDIISPTIRKNHSEIFIIFNPYHILDYVYDRFIIHTPNNCQIQKLNYLDNPHISETLLNDVNVCKNEDINDYNHIYLGEPKTNDDLAIIKYAWVMSAIDAHLKLNIDVKSSKYNRIGYDVADSGADKNCIIYRKGCLCDDLVEWSANQDELFQSSERVYNFASKTNSFVVFDSIGVGAGVGSNFKKIGGLVNAIPFNAGGRVVKPNYFYKHKVRNKDMFANAKSQSWWLVADMFLNTYLAIQGKEHDKDNIISISSKLPKLDALISELITPLIDKDTNGLSKVESKKDLTKRGIKSPNKADAFIMAYTPIIIASSSNSIENLNLPI